MIKKCAYIKRFTPEQKQQLEVISAAHKIKNATDVLLFALEQYQKQKNTIARLTRLLESKKQEIKKLKGEV